jgi:hypothetical protein
MGDDKDREYLNSLTELEREKILNARHKKREELKRKKELLDKLNNERGAENERRNRLQEMDKLKVSCHVKLEAKRSKIEKRQRQIWILFLQRRI